MAKPLSFKVKAYIPSQETICPNVRYTVLGFKLRGSCSWLGFVVDDDHGDVIKLGRIVNVIK